MRKGIQIIGCICLAVLLLTGCKSLRTTTVPTPPKEARYLSSRLQVMIPGGGGSLTANGTMKLKEGERVQVSVLMPILRNEIARLELTPNDVLLIDRMNKRYVRATREELKDALPANATFSMLEKMLFDAAKPTGKKELSGNELGIPLLENTKVKLYDFTSEPFVLTPTEVSDKYTQVPLRVLLNMLTDI